MGCINSKKDVNDAHSNIFHVINLDDDGTERWSGQLEVSRTELTLYRKGKDPTTWPLKCLRRYGFNVDQFSFEAGRRCATGEGIYAFRCRRAEALFYTVQSYIQGRIYNDETTNPNDPYPIPVASNGPSVAARSVSQNNTATRSTGGGGGGGGGGGQGQQGPAMQCTFVMNRTGMATSQSLSPNGTIHSNSNQSRSTDTLAMAMEGNYLEPTPNRTGTGVATAGGPTTVVQPHTITTRFQQGLRLSSVSSGPISPDITSPGSPNSMTNILEVTTLNPLPTSHTSGSVHQGVSNLYQEFPVKDTTALQHQLHLHHHHHHVHHPIGASNVAVPGANLPGGGGGILVRTSMDVPPQELAPVAVTGTHNPSSALLCDPSIVASTAVEPCGGAGGDLPPSTPDGLDPGRMYMNVNISASVGDGNANAIPGGPAKAKKAAAFSSKSNSSLISISNFNNNNNNNSTHHSTGSFDEGQYQNVRTPTSSGPTAGGCTSVVSAAAAPTGNIFAQFHRLNSSSAVTGPDPTRFYENLEPAELKASLLRGAPRCSKPDIFSNVELPPVEHSEPCTPTATGNSVAAAAAAAAIAAAGAHVRKVNYIVLDLDQSSSSHNISGSTGSSGNGTGGVLSPTGSVPGVTLNGNGIPNGSIPIGTGGGSNGTSNGINNNNNNSTVVNLNGVATTPLIGTGTGIGERGGVVVGSVATVTTVATGVGLLPPESPKKASLGYATIDFNKTVALSNSTTPSSELDSEGSRKTRHNSTVTPLARQSNSVSD
ncbi:protein lingerer [Anopheles aquasalis]|uniref:protein lingerer n=1 Tax=Anopheles aquasalis TaxID=42839 RepID=UPI00215A4A23|nr:protein lingerer [Anopheles aquasalis]